MADDPYKTLAVPKTASDKDIRVAYRKLAKELHPDLNPGDSIAEDKFKEVTAAFGILGDKAQRARYDRGEIDMKGQQRAPHGFYRRHSHSGRASENFEGLGDIFNDIFGDRGGAQFRGRDLKYKLEVDFLEAALGSKKRLTLPTGETLDLTIPAGVEEGQIMRLKGKGEKTVASGPSGDALIEITVLSHQNFERNGNDIWIELPITLDEAILGAKIDVPTLSGGVTVAVPEGSSSGQVLRLRGKGIKNTKMGQAGDQHVRLKIILPEKIDPDLKSFMEKWRKAHDYRKQRKL